ncbi:MAG: asparaginase [Paracoccaceae bacterium]|nr:asparaginase [Paracoccaceae bacterium]
MQNSVPLVDLWRGPVLESRHLGAAVICDDTGQIKQAWGNPTRIILPRSSCKMIQALPLITSGAADTNGLKSEHLALACASHNGADIHLAPISKWLETLGLKDEDFRCGPQKPKDRATRHALLRARQPACQIHNNCSGKHAGFLTLNKYLAGQPDYEVVDHPVQKAAFEAFEMTTDEISTGFGIDGCSAPNHSCSLQGLARAMAWFASAEDRSDSASKAAVRLVKAMNTHPELVAGDGRACTGLMQAMGGRGVIKTGAEGVFTAILPTQRLGIALKVDDGTTRASDAAIAALLVHLGVLAPDHPTTKMYINAPQRNWRGITTGRLDINPAFLPHLAQT